MKNIAILILAAGKSSRMNSIKQLEKIKDETLLDIILQKATPLFFENIFCVLGANASVIQEEIKTKNIEFIINKKYEQGLSTSIVAGLHHFKKNNLNFGAVMVLLADQPAITTSYLEIMLQLFKNNSNKIIASNYGKKFGVPAIFPKIYFDKLLLIEGDKGAKEFINDKKNDVLCPATQPNLVDIDTQEDLKNYIKSV